MASQDRVTVSFPPGIETAFRDRMEADYGEQIPGIAETPIAKLMRFAILVATGIKPEDAKRGLRGLSRGNTRSENIKV